MSAYLNKKQKDSEKIIDEAILKILNKDKNGKVLKTIFDGISKIGLIGLAFATLYEKPELLSQLIDFFKTGKADNITLFISLLANLGLGVTATKIYNNRKHVIKKLSNFRKIVEKNDLYRSYSGLDEHGNNPFIDGE